MDATIYHNPACGTSRNTLADAELGLDNPDLTDEQLLVVMSAPRTPINRPFVVTPLGTRLARPSEAVLDILPDTFKEPFFKEDGEQVLDQEGKRIA